MEEEQIIIQLKTKMVVLKILPFDTDINVDELLKIDYSNLVGEILTFPVVLNRVQNLKAEMNNLVNESKTDLEAFEAELTEKKRNSLTAAGSKVTVSEVDAAVKMDASYIAKKKSYFAQVCNLDYLDSLYWSAQCKSKLLEKISDKIRPDEFAGELLTDTINGVLIKMTKKAIV